MKEEKSLIQDGTLGLVGSPFQQSGNQSQIQTTQNTPKGTPSEGRPKGKPAVTPKDKDAPRPSGASPKAKKASASLSEWSIEDIEKELLRRSSELE